MEIIEKEIMTNRIKVGKKKLRTVGMREEKLREKIRMIKEIIGWRQRKEVRIVIGEYFNVRTRETGCKVIIKEEEKNIQKNEKSKDSKIENK